MSLTCGFIHQQGDGFSVFLMIYNHMFLFFLLAFCVVFLTRFGVVFLQLKNVVFLPIIYSMCNGGVI